MVSVISAGSSGHCSVVLICDSGRADVARDQVELLLGHRREAPDAQVARHDDDGNLHAGEQVEQIGVHARQLFVARVQLVVHRVQLFVGRLQLFLRGVELFVRALQLFVARENFLVRRLQLLVGRLDLLNRRLQVFARGGELFLELADAAARRRLLFASRRLLRPFALRGAVAPSGTAPGSTDVPAGRPESLRCRSLAKVVP